MNFKTYHYCSCFSYCIISLAAFWTRRKNKGKEKSCNESHHFLSKSGPTRKKLFSLPLGSPPFLAKPDQYTQVTFLALGLECPWPHTAGSRMTLTSYTQKISQVFKETHGLGHVYWSYIMNGQWQGHENTAQGVKRMFYEWAFNFISPRFKNSWSIKSIWISGSQMNVFKMHFWPFGICFLILANVYTIKTKINKLLLIHYACTMCQALC